MTPLVRLGNSLQSKMLVIVAQAALIGSGIIGLEGCRKQIADLNPSKDQKVFYGNESEDEYVVSASKLMPGHVYVSDKPVKIIGNINQIDLKVKRHLEVAGYVNLSRLEITDVPINKKLEVVNGFNLGGSQTIMTEIHALKYPEKNSVNIIGELCNSIIITEGNIVADREKNNKVTLSKFNHLVSKKLLLSPCSDFVPSFN